MEILPSNDKNFNTMAAAVLRRHLDTGKPYSECVAEVAESEGLTPEETRRLVEKANTALSIAHLRSEDRKANFDLASVEDVLERTHLSEEEDSPKPDASPKEEKTASLGMFSSLPNTRRRASFNPFACLREKTAETSYNVGRELGALKRRLDSLSLVKVASEVAANEKFSKLVDLVESMPDKELAEFVELCVSSPETRRLLTALQVACKDGCKLDSCADAVLDGATDRVLDDTSAAYGLAREIVGDLDVMDRSASEMERLSDAKETLRRCLC